MAFNPWEIAFLLFATIGPLKVTLVCASLTADASQDFVRRLAFRSVLTASIVCLLFVLFGEAILMMFKVSIPAFQIGGGLMVLRFAFDMASSDKAVQEAVDGEGPAKVVEPSLDLATCPLAVPLMASVAGLVAIVSALAQRADLKAMAFLSLVIAAIMAINYACLCSCRRISRLLGRTAVEVIGKLMGVMIAALAVEMIMMGLIGWGIVAAPPWKGKPPVAQAEASEASGDASPAR